MKRFAVGIAVGAAVLLGGCAANAGNSAKSSAGVTQTTDFSSQNRHGGEHRAQRVVRQQHGSRPAPRHGERRGHRGGGGGSHGDGPSVSIGVGGGHSGR